MIVMHSTLCKLGLRVVVSNVNNLGATTLLMLVSMNTEHTSASSKILSPEVVMRQEAKRSTQSQGGDAATSQETSAGI
jgi:hypothetical protein